jgi:hypothetical protein
MPTWPTTTVPTGNLDAGSDQPSAARADIKTMADVVNELVAYGTPSGGDATAHLDITGSNISISAGLWRRPLAVFYDPTNLVGTITSNAFNLPIGQYTIDIPTFLTNSQAGSTVILKGNTSGSELTWNETSAYVSNKSLIPGDLRYFTVGVAENLELRTTGTSAPSPLNSKPTVKLTRLTTSIPPPTSTQDVASVTASGSGGPFSNGGWATLTGGGGSVPYDNGSRSLNNPTYTFGQKQIGGGTAGTIDFWFYYDTGGGTPSNATGFFANNTILYNQLRTFMLWRQNYNNSFSWSDAGTALLEMGNLTTATWHHFSLQTSGNNTWYAWINGVYKGSFSNGNTFTNLNFGAAGMQNNPWPWAARYSNVRWSSNQRYTAGSNFTVPAAAYTWDATTEMLFKGADNNPTTS